MSSLEKMAVDLELRWRRDHRNEPVAEESDETPTPVEPLSEEELREMLSKRRKLGDKQ